MDQGSSSSEFAQVLERLTRLEQQSTAQQATITAQQAIIADQQGIIAEQQRIIIEQRATIASLQDALTTAHEQISLLKKSLFSPKRERNLPSPDQQLLFDTELPAPPPADLAAALPAAFSLKKARP